MANLIVALNCSATDAEYGTPGVDWVDMSANDYLVFSAGSDSVADGEAIPSQAQLNQAGVVLTGIEQTVSKYFLADISDNLLKEINLMGNQDKRYVMAFDFDDATATEPTLEMWDDATMLTTTGITLGDGTPSNSWWKGVPTTAGSPGSSWSGTALAGSGSGRYLNLNNGSGALASADTLYCNLKIVIPASASSGINAQPKIVVKYASN